MRRSVWGFGVLLIFCLGMPVWAQELAIRLELDREEISLGEAVRLVVHVEGDGRLDEDSTLGGLEEVPVRLVGRSPNLPSGNGGGATGIDFFYLLEPERSGVFVIGPVYLDQGEVRYTSGSVRLVVGKSLEDAPGGDLFLRAELSAAEGYVGEQIFYTLRLYRRVSVDELVLQLPEDEGLRFDQMEKPQEYRRRVAGRDYQVLEMRYLLMPLKAARYDLGGARMRLAVHEPRRKSRSVFDDPGFVAGRPVTLRSDPLYLLVREIPREGRPVGFNGLVGDFTVAARVDASVVQVGDSVSLVIEVAGRGDGRLIPDFSLPEMEGVKIHADQPQLTRGSDGREGTVIKSFRWTMVPQVAGSVHVPSFVLVFFDPGAGRFRQVRSQEFLLRVRAAQGQVPVRETSAAVGRHSR